MRPVAACPRAVRGAFRGPEPGSLHFPDELRARAGSDAPLGSRNPENGAIAVLAIYRNQVLVAILNQATCLTVLTWNQFLPRLRRVRPRPEAAGKWGRVLRRLVEETRELEILPGIGCRLGGQCTFANTLI